MSVMQTRSISAMAAAPLIAIATLSATAAAQCGPERFDYGPTSDPFYAAIVIDHHGPGGPLLPPLAEYERAQRDVPLIRGAFPAIAAVGHATADLQPPTLTAVTSTWPDLAPEVVCANEFYGVEVRVLSGIRMFQFTFPAPVNGGAIATIYAQLPGITRVDPSGLGCAGCCEFESWSYDRLPGGAWRWTVNQVRAGRGFCYSLQWTIDVTEAGVVSLVSRPCYADCDASGELDFFDFLCFQDAFAAGDPDADCDGSGSLDFFDFLCFQNSFAAGCP